MSILGIDLSGRDGGERLARDVHEGVLKRPVHQGFEPISVGRDSPSIVAASVVVKSSLTGSTTAPVVRSA